MNGIYQVCPYLDASKLYSFRELIVWIVCTAFVMFILGVLVGGMCEARANTLDDQERRLEAIEFAQRKANRNA